MANTSAQCQLLLQSSEYLFAINFSFHYHAISPISTSLSSPAQREMLPMSTITANGNRTAAVSALYAQSHEPSNAMSACPLEIAPIWLGCEPEGVRPDNRVFDGKRVIGVIKRRFSVFMKRRDLGRATSASLL
jgi:hypothetical protein